MQSSRASCFLLLLLCYLPAIAPFSWPKPPTLPPEAMLRLRQDSGSKFPFLCSKERQNYELDILEASTPLIPRRQERQIMIVHSSASPRNSEANSLLMLSGSAARAIRFDDKVARLILARSQFAGERIHDGNLSNQYTRITSNSMGISFTRTANHKISSKEEESSSARKILMHRVMRPRNVSVPPSGPSRKIHSEPSTR